MNTKTKTKTKTNTTTAIDAKTRANRVRVARILACLPMEVIRHLEGVDPSIHVLESPYADATVRLDVRPGGVVVRRKYGDGTKWKHFGEVTDRDAARICIRVLTKSHLCDVRVA